MEKVKYLFVNYKSIYKSNSNADAAAQAAHLG